MHSVIHPDFSAGAAQVLPWLEADPVSNGLQIGIIQAIVDGLLVTDQPPLLAHVEDAGRIVGVALQSDTYRRLVLSAMPDAAATALAATVLATDRRLPGVIGPVPAAGDFAAAWTDLSGQRSELAMAQRLHRLDRVHHPAGVPGQVRTVQQVELELVCAWATAMAEDIGLDAGDRDPRLAEQMERRIEDDRMLVWEVDGEPVSMAGPSRHNVGVVRIGLVYTPPSHRRQGYAAACVAAVSQRALDSGATTCALYTDLSNPTSNGVYRRIGYYPVCDAEELTFLP